MSRLQQLVSHVVSNPKTFVSNTDVDALAAEALWDGQLGAEETAVLSGAVSDLQSKGFAFESTRAKGLLEQLARGALPPLGSGAYDMEGLRHGRVTPATLDRLAVLMLSDGFLDAKERVAFAKALPEKSEDYATPSTETRAKELLLRNMGSAKELMAAPQKVREAVVDALLTLSGHFAESLKAAGITHQDVLNSVNDNEPITYGSGMMPESVVQKAKQIWTDLARASGEPGDTPSWESLEKAGRNGEDLGYKLVFAYERDPSGDTLGKRISLDLLLDPAGNVLREAHDATDVHPAEPEECSGYWSDPERYPPQGWVECGEDHGDWD